MNEPYKLIKPNHINNSNNICNFCCNNFIPLTKYLKNNFGWKYCMYCKDLCNNNNMYFCKKNYVLTYELFMDLIKDIKLPITYKVFRSNGDIESNWKLYDKFLLDKYFLTWFRNDWIILLTNGTLIKEVSLEEVKIININHNIDIIIDKLNNFLI